MILDQTRLRKVRYVADHRRRIVQNLSRRLVSTCFYFNGKLLPRMPVASTVHNIRNRRGLGPLQLNEYLKKKSVSPALVE